MAESSSKKNQKPNIVFILSDDFGYGDAGVYGGGENRGMPTPISTEWQRKGCSFYLSMRGLVAPLIVLRC